MRTNLLKKLILSLGLGVAGLSVHNAQAAAEFRTGSLKVEIWSGVGGTALSALTGDPRYPSNPSETRFIKFAEFPAGTDDGTQPAGDVMNDYGWKISGVILPKTTGNYIFFIAADDNAGLWLSTDDTPANLKQIASEPQWNQVRTWTSTSRRPGCPDNGGAKCENRSNPIRLEAGKRYYLEALAKEGGGGDNLAVTMTQIRA